MQLVLRALATLAAAWFAGGCARGHVTTVDGVEVYDHYWRQTEEQLLNRARFDFGCAGPFELTLMQKAGRYPSQVGVSGCGRRAIYTRPNVGVYVSSTWILDSTSSDAPGDTSQPVEDEAQRHAQAEAPEGDLASSLSAEDALHAAIDLRRQGVADCTQQDVVVVAAWSADGTVTISLLGDLAGSTSEECVQAALADVQAQATGNSGAITHHVGLAGD
jgi:hypothetical protein